MKLMFKYTLIPYSRPDERANYQIASSGSSAKISVGQMTAKTENLLDEAEEDIVKGEPIGSFGGAKQATKPLVNSC